MKNLQPPSTVEQKQSETELQANLEQDQDIDVSTTEAKQPNFEKNNQQSWLGLLLFISVAMNGVALWQMFSSNQPISPPSAVAAKAPPPRPVEVTTLSRGNSTRRVQLLGQVESRQQSTIRAQTGGAVQQILVQPGDRVTPGMTIAILDDADQKLALFQAQAQLAQQRNNLARLEVGTRPEIIAQRQAALRSAQAMEREALDNVQRQTQLVQEGAIAKRLLVEAQAAVGNTRGERLEAQARLAEAKAGPTREEIAAQRSSVAAAVAAVNQAKLQLERTRIKAGSGGVVLQRQVSSGDYVERGGEIITLVAGNRLDIFLELPEQLSGRVATGTRVELTARALPQWRGNATITGVVPSADAASRRQRVRVKLDKPPQGLLPGMAITGNLQLSNNNQGFVVSRDALTRRADKWLVFTVENGKAKALEVDMVADMGQQVGISGAGLQNGQNLVVRGGDGLRDGAKVRVVDS
ncbi:MAG: efflux RND transporter periplasmic adaptor subunit [Calothrix sp. MO_167.B42]|nr:efflux RND transporter periplasmic adaptor subunit [Calothrix sp. MO_167.B42]